MDMSVYSGIQQKARKPQAEWAGVGGGETGSVKVGVKRCAKSLECALSAVKNHWGIRIQRGHARIDT